jgi:hypothetical protein
VAVADEDDEVVEDELVEEPVAVVAENDEVEDDEVEDDEVVEHEPVEEPVAVADEDDEVVEDEPVEDEAVESEPEPARQVPAETVAVANGAVNGNGNGHARDPRLTKRRSRFYLGSTRR